MKTITFILTILFISGLTGSRAQNTWTQKADCGGTVRGYATGFSIGDKGYIGTGYTYDGINGHYYNDFWEYDPATDTWTQKADFSGGTRAWAVGFSIDTKGYIGTGTTENVPYWKKDFWEYDADANTWTQKANFPSTARGAAVGFSIDGKGYLEGGDDENFDTKIDFWEYDPDLDTWTQKSDFAGVARSWSSGFSIGSKGYVGTGFSLDQFMYYKDFWEYDPANDAWTQKTNFAGTARSSAVGLSIGSKGYIGTGYDGLNDKNDFWEYDPDLDVWTQKADFAGPARSWSVGLSIGSKGYIGTGEDNSDLFTFTKDFWRYDPDVANGIVAYSEDYVKMNISPDPAEDHTTIQFTLPHSSHVRLEVFDISGKEIETLLNEDEEQGDHSLMLGTHQLSKGVYAVKMLADYGTTNQKLIVE